MKTLLLTDIEPFLHFTINPTMRIVEELNEAEIGSYKIHGEILSVDFKTAGTQLLHNIESIQPDAVISLGLAAGRFKFTPERVAINISDAEPDNSGNTPVDEIIQLEGADAYFSTLPIREMVNQLRADGLPAGISNTAGTYLCNHVMYQGLHYAKTHQRKMPSGFLHMPASHELAIQHGKIPSSSHEDLLKGVGTCIEVLSRHE